jgi:2TM domain
LTLTVGGGAVATEAIAALADRVSALRRILLFSRRALRTARPMTDPESPRRQYTSEEAASIITRVLERQNGEGGRISHDELLETARDIGVTTLELEAAVVEETKLRAEMIVREEQRERALRRLLRHVAAYVVAGAFCFVLGVRVTGGVWYFYVLLGWGLAVALHAARVLVPTARDRQLAARGAAAKPTEVRDGKLELKPRA